MTTPSCPPMPGRTPQPPMAEHDDHAHGDLDDLHLDMGDLRLEADEPAHEAEQEEVDAFELDPSDLDFEEPVFHAQEAEDSPCRSPFRRA